MYLLFTIAIEKAQKRLHSYYTSKEFIRPEHDWPPYHFKYFTPLAIIYENMHTKPITATSTGSTLNDQECDNKTTEDINSLFSAYRGCRSYKILIEGEPGIGKTILSSEIAAQWADPDKDLLKDKAIVFLLFMRQPETKNISNAKSLVEHFFHDDMPLVNELTEWLVNSNGKHITIVLDGYDEASTYSAFYDFVNQLIAHKTLPECGLVITSRPAESSHLHGRVNCRAEVLGFTEQSRLTFIDKYVEKQEKEKQIYQTSKLDVIEHNVKKKIGIIQKTLKHNPIINALCYIPLNATMLLLCLTESEEEIDLPTTATTLYERFIIITIKRFLHSKPGFTDAILKFKDLPKQYYATFEQLSKFAYSVSIHMDDEKSMQLVFELADIENTCENFASHGNGLGLLKPASFLDMGIQNKYPSYNFLHKSIQEYMVAYHIASLPPKMLSDLLNKKFWDSSYFNVWVMYVGITKGEQKEFKHFLSGSRFKFLAPNPSRISQKILKNKIKCLHLLRCAAEVKESKFLESVRTIFKGQVIDLSNKALSVADIKTLAVLLLDLPGGPWTLNLSRCNINNEHCKVLFEILSSQTVTMNIQTVDVSFNNISSESLYRLCNETFKSWKTKEVILPIDALHNSVVTKRIKDFKDNLENLIQTNWQSSGILMILYQANQGMIIVVYSNVNYVKCFQLYVSDLNNDVAKRLQRLVMKELKGHRIGHVYFSYSIYKHHDVEMLSYIIENFQIIKFCGLNMHSKGAYLLDNTSKVDFQIEKAPSMCLVDFLAAILQNSVQVNPSPCYLSMLSDKVKEETESNLRKISTVKVLNLANSNLSDCIADDIELILSCNKLEEVYLGGNNLQEAGMIKITDTLKSNNSLKIFDISNININSKTVNSIAVAIASVDKLTLCGANIDEALAKSHKEKQYAVTAALLIIKAAMENDRILVMKLYGENVSRDTKIPLTEEDDLGELQAAVASNNIRTVVPIEISRRHNAGAVREELLLRTDVDKDSGVVLWFGLRLTQLEISWLRKIYWVKKLRLARNAFSSLPPEMGSYLKQCTKLDLQWNRIHEIPQCLLELPSINELNLSHNDLVNIPDVPEWSPSLSVLDLSYNRLSNLPNSAVAPTLKNLNISNNRFRTVPHCVCSFVGLTTLNIAHNSEILSLPSELGRLKNLLNLNLDGLNDLCDPPRSVRVTTADCIRYLNRRLRSARGYYHMKMVLVGKQAMGKSTIVARLHNKDIGNESTVGVDVSEWKYAPAYNKKTFHFSIWDFAGQEEYYATHQCFLSKRSLYLLVWNVTEGDAGVADLKPWLNNISVRAPDSCVIVVGTFLDKVSKEDRQSGKIDDLLRKVEELTRQYHRLVVTNTTVVGLKGRMENVAKLKNYIYNAAADYKIKNQYVMGHKISSSYHALDNKLSTIHRLVKDGKHEPIMHAAEFQSMVRDLNLVDIQDDDELRIATHFLHEVGALLHYDDRKHNLDDLYFVDPRWLCDLMSTVVTVQQRNPYVKQGILRSKNIPILFKDKRFPNKYFNQYLTLLSRFEIALPLDKDHKWILIPSMLPEKRPDIVAAKQLDDKSCYKRYILFRSSMAQGQKFRRPTPPGLWSRLLSRIMNTIKEVKNILSEHVPIEEESDLVISSNFCLTSTSTSTSAFTGDTDYITKNGVVYGGSDRSGVHSPAPSSPPVSKASSVQDHQHLSHESQQRSVEVFSIKGGDNLIYWRTGLFYKVNKVAFIIESLAELRKYQDKDGVLIMASQGAEGCKILGQLIDIVEQLISEWYPGLHGELEQRAPCIECIKNDIPNPYEFKVDQLLPLIADHKLTHKCGGKHNVKLVEIVPDLLLQDLDPAFLLDPKEVIYKQEKESLLGTGAFGEVYRGKYKGRAVAIKLYTAKENIKVEESFKELRAESKVLEQLHHPSLVCMVGVTIHPMMSLVLEEAPEGSLQAPLLREQQPFSRIVMHRIAIQVASALHFLHSINIIFRDLKADSVLLWSLSPDHLINCKVTDFNIAAHADPGGARGLHGTKGFVAPEVARVNHAKESSVYDHQADIFSFGMLLYQLLARRHPFHNVQPFKIEAAIEEGQRPQLGDVTIADTGLYYMSRVMKLCWEGSPKDRPTSQQIVEWLSATALQLIISVIPVSSKYSIRNGCIVTPVMSNEVGPVPTSSELWICCDGVEGAELIIFTTNTMVKAGKHFVREKQVRCMKQCGEHVWVASRAGLEYGVMDIFNNNTKDLIHNIKMSESENAVSCITNSDQLVYIGTMEGYCFAFTMDVASIQGDSKPRYKYVSEHCVDGVALTHTCLWASTRSQILFLNPETLDLEGVEKRTKNTHAFVGKIMLSDNGDQMWTAHLGGVITSAWNACQRTHICDVDVGVLAKEKCHVKDPQDQIMTAMCTALDTVWIGLASGFIMVFGMNPPGELLTYFRPYNSFIHFLSASKYPGPCQKEECMMVCGGKMYRPDESFKELTDYERKGEKGEPVDTAGVAVLWEVLPAKYTRQVQYLSEGKSWLNYSTLEKTMTDTGFTESMKYCHSAISSSATTDTTTQDECYTD